MAKTVRDTKLDSKLAREKLSARGKPYWRELDRGLHVGYRRLKGTPGRWCVRLYDSDKRKYVTETMATADDSSDTNGIDVLSWAQAQTEARKRRDARVQGASGHGPYTVTDALRDCPMSTDARFRANAMIVPVLGDVVIAADLTTERLNKFLTQLASTPARLRTVKGAKQRHRAANDAPDAVRARKNTANRIFAILRRALNFAFENEKVPSKTAWQRVKPFKGVSAARVRYLTNAEAQRLINAAGADPEFRDLARAALETGARYGELAAIRVEDFHGDSGTLRVDGKTGVHHVVLTEEGRAFFASLCAGRAGGELLLRRSDGAAWGPSNQTVPMALACARGSITPPANFHALRHTWASLSVMAGAPLHVVARNLGHADTRMVEKHYGHLAPSYVADEIRRAAPRYGIEPEQKIKRLG
jgi:integrase